MFHPSATRLKTRLSHSTSHSSAPLPIIGQTPQDPFLENTCAAAPPYTLPPLNIQWGLAPGTTLYPIKSSTSAWVVLGLEFSDSKKSWRWLAKAEKDFCFRKDSLAGSEIRLLAIVDQGSLYILYALQMYCSRGLEHPRWGTCTINAGTAEYWAIEMSPSVGLTIGFTRFGINYLHSMVVLTDPDR